MPRTGLQEAAHSRSRPARRRAGAPRALDGALPVGRRLPGDAVPHRRALATTSWATCRGSTASRACRAGRSPRGARHELGAARVRRRRVELRRSSSRCAAWPERRSTRARSWAACCCPDRWPTARRDAYRKHVFGDSTLQDCMSSRASSSARRTSRPARNGGSPASHGGLKVGLIPRPTEDLAVAVAASAAFPRALTARARARPVALRRRGRGDLHGRRSRRRPCCRTAASTTTWAWRRRGSAARRCW